MYVDAFWLGFGAGFVFCLLLLILFAVVLGKRKDPPK